MSDDAAAEDRVGELVDGRYKLLAVMAAGSMGAVYRAERVPVGKVVAVKFLHASFANDPEFQARFERETRVMSKLAHPNCVSVLDFGVWQGAPYLVMDYIAGTTLRARMDKGPMPPSQALAIARQLAAGLAHAHEQGVFHRDIKPANVMITDEIGHGERVRILDFGLARLRGASNSGRDATQINMVVGTPNYMAPEQTVPGAMIDARTDIYAVGVVLFEMIVGDRPFHAEETLQLLGMHRAAPIPRLADRVPVGTELPDGLQALIDKAMAKSPSDRFQSAIELANAIDEVAGGKPEPLIVKESRPISGPALAPTVLDLATESDVIAPRARSRFWPNLISALILVGGVTALAGYFIRRHPSTHGTVATQAIGDAVVAASGSAGSQGSAGSAAVVASTQVGSGAEGSAAGSGSDLGSAGSDLGSAGSDLGSAGSDLGSAGSDLGSAALAGSDLGSAALAGSGLGSASPAGSDLGSAAAAGSDLGSAAGSDTGSDAGSDVEMDPNPEKADDPAPAASKPAPGDDDEAADAPETSAEVARRPQPPPAHIANNLHDAVLLIKAGKNDLALASLRRLESQKKNAASAYIPFLMGNLYFDKKWWSVALEQYQTAISRNAQYRRNPTLNRNVVRMLGNSRTKYKAVNFLRGVVGRPCVIYLRAAAEHDKNAAVRAEAKRLYPYIH